MRGLGGVLAVLLVVAVACTSAEARAGKGRSVGGLFKKANATEAAPAAPRRNTNINLIVRPRAARAPAAAVGALPAGFGLPGDDYAPAGRSLASAHERGAAYPECPRERVFGKGVGFCEVN
jgi:hypothetical protein